MSLGIVVRMPLSGYINDGKKEREMTGNVSCSWH